MQFIESVRYSKVKRSESQVARDDIAVRSVKIRVTLAVASVLKSVWQQIAARDSQISEQFSVRAEVTSRYKCTGHRDKDFEGMRLWISMLDMVWWEKKPKTRPDECISEAGGLRCVRKR